MVLCSGAVIGYFLLVLATLLSINKKIPSLDTHDYFNPETTEVHTKSILKIN